MPWKFRLLDPIEQENDALKTTICCLRRELENKNQYTGKLEYLVHERSERIDELSAKLEQLREQLRRLGLENEILTAMIAAPPLDAAMLVPK